MDITKEENMSVKPGDRSPWLARVSLTLGLLVVILISGGGLVYYAFNLLTRAELSPTNLYKSVTSQHPTLDDSLDGSKVGKWETYTKGQASCTFNKSALHIIMQPVQAFNTLIISSSNCFLHDMSFHNFAFQVRMTILYGHEILAGMFFRSDTTGQQSYRFYLDFYGNYNFVTEKNGGPVGATISSAAPGIKEDSTHILSVIAQGSTFYLYLDEKYVNKVTDNLYPAGRIGLFATRDDLPLTDIAFSNAKVWEL